MFVFDFETKGIESRPNYPPEPVGVAVGLVDDEKSSYLAWGHPSGNNTNRQHGTDTLFVNWGDDLLCHNAAFDLAVAHEKLRLPLPKGSQINDTMVMAFLLDPYGELSLKPLAEQYLAMPPAERDAVRDWLKENVKMPTGRRPTDKQCGAMISMAPAGLVGPYAAGDCDRTVALYKFFLPMLESAGLMPAYRREMDLMPMLLDNAAQGIPLDHKRLAADTAHYEKVLVQVDKDLRMNWRKEVGGEAPENFDAPEELADALSKNYGLRSLLPKTPTGKISTAKDTLLACLPNWRVKGLLLYRSALTQCLSTYMRPWCEHGDALHCNWNQVRNYEDFGAKTGRLSSSPNMQNITNPEKYDELMQILQDCSVPSKNYTLPNLRSYLIAPKGHMLFSRDYSQQELRFLAHYEDGALAQGYRDDPGMDVHQFVSELIKEQTGIELSRKPTKTINFGKVYGMGAPTLSARLGITIEEARDLIAAYDQALPSVKGLQREINNIGRGGEYITTIGGRRYYSAEPKRREDGSLQTFEYRLLNYLIQGSSADQTKEAMRLWWNEIEGTDTRFLLTVHDQLVGCAPIKKAKKASKVLDECMRNAFTLDVPMKTDPTYGYNFGEMAK